MAFPLFGNRIIHSTRINSKSYATQAMNTAKKIFLDALELPSGKRLTFIRKETEGNSDLLDEVASLVDAYQSKTASVFAKKDIEEFLSAIRSDIEEDPQKG